MKEKGEIMKFNYLELAETIKERRLEKGISTRKLADKIGVSHAEISRFENGLKANFYFVPFIKMCKELDLDLFNLLDDVGLYEVDFDKLYYVMFKSKNENIFKIHARCEGEALRIALDFVMENNLIEIDETLENMLMAVVENPEDFNKKIIENFEKTNQLLHEKEEDFEEETEELDADSFMEMQCENCEYRCPHCGQCTLGE